MKARIERWLQDAWYREMYLSTWIMPLSLLYVDVVRLRRFLYRIGLKRSVRLPVPVVVVGNLTVGGTGKTPLVAWLARFLAAEGYRPGIISRGYGGKQDAPRPVTAASDPALVGDEAVLLATHSGCPVWVGRNRPAAGRALLAAQACDILLADDGLQHYALQRDIEIVVVDGQRRFGNGYCLPAGPLREPPERLKQVDLVIVNGPVEEPQPGEYAMHCRGTQLVNLLDGRRLELAEFRGRRCHAVAGIGNPARFFAQLRAAGLDCDCRAMPDHHVYQAADLAFAGGEPLLMTEKDAVKCRSFATGNCWYLPVTAEPAAAFVRDFVELLKKHHG